MSHFETFQVFPYTPKPLLFLETLSRNLWWTWNLDAIELFRRIDPRLWEESGRNPIVFSTMVRQERLEGLAHDDSFLAHIERVKKKFESQILKPSNFSTSLYSKNDIIAYFSMEFGIHESLPFFAGGLGVLSGDHLKAASDLDLPMVAVGILYRRGYFHQFLDPSGWQQEEYPESDLYHLPVRRAKDPDGHELTITVQGSNGPFKAIVWVLMVGRIPLYLMDTNIPENTPETREITDRLYVGDEKLRLAQEILLGIGGMRALTLLGIEPSVFHMNEGHCGFAGLERLAAVMEKNHIDFKTAMEVVPRTMVFTTHTPVAAGHDAFPTESVRSYLVPFEQKLGIGVREIIALGQAPGSGPDSPLSMFVLAMNLSQYCNGVSELHGAVARRMWAHVWAGRPNDEVPITHVTNGVHIASWISIEISLLFERYLGPDWQLQTWNPEMAARVDEIYDEELWRSHEMARSRLIRTCRSLMLKQYGRRNAPRSVMEAAESILDQEVLTIGFARRFATYKRATLLLHDPDRLEALLTNSSRPVQIIFAGKAHPRDNEGKELIKRLIEFARRPALRHRVAFIEDYDINVTRHLVQGADVWLNTPRRPMEACGTSGMKAAANGLLNLSIMDGWWCEGYQEDRGWRIGNGEEYDDYAYQDAVESQALYNILENEVIPCFYERKNGDAPTRWIQMMKAAIKMAMLEFGSQCMVKNYEEKFYARAAKNYHILLQNSAEAAKALKLQYERLVNLWKGIKVDIPLRDANGPFRVGENFRVSTVVRLGELRPDEVDVELYYGSMKSIDTLSASSTQPMHVEEDKGDGAYLYGCSISCNTAGRFGFTARVTPRGDQRIKFNPHFLTWAN